jgi:hypothetical protein
MELGSVRYLILARQGQPLQYAGHTQAQDATTWVSTPEGDEAQGGRGAKRRQVAPTPPDVNGTTHTRRP